MKTMARNVGLAVAVWAVTAALGSSALAADITWKAPIWGPKRASSEPFAWYAKEVAAKTGGQLKIEFTYDQGKAADALDKLTSGAADAGYICTPYYGDQMPLVTVMDLPLFAPDSIAALGRVQLALADHPVIQAELRKSGIKMLLPAPLPQYQMMSMRRIAKLDDLQGAKVRIIKEMGKVLEEYGASIHTMPIADALPLMKSGSIDAAVLPGYAFVSYNVHDTAKYMTDKISLGAQFCYLGVSQKSWDALPAKIQEVMLGLRQPALALYEEIYAREDVATVAAMKQKGVEITIFSTTDRTRLIAKAIKIWQAWVEERDKQGLKGREIFEFAQAKIREFTRR